MTLSIEAFITLQGEVQSQNRGMRVARLFRRSECMRHFGVLCGRQKLNTVFTRTLCAANRQEVCSLHKLLFSHRYGQAAMGPVTNVPLYRIEDTTKESSAPAAPVTP